jgi:type I restriction enzyme, S subunit
LQGIFFSEIVGTVAEIAKREGRDYEMAEVLLERIKEEKRRSRTKRES